MKKIALMMLLFCLSGTAVFADVGITLNSPVNSQSFASCSDIVFDVDVNTTASKIKEVRLYANGGNKGRVTKDPFDFTWENVPSGNYEVFLKVKDGNNDEAYTDTIRIHVGGLERNDMLINGSFDCGDMQGWEKGYTAGDAVVDFLMMDDHLFDDDRYLWVNITEKGTDIWHIQIQQRFKLKAGHTYSITFSAMADDARSVRMDFQQINAPWTAHFSEHIELTDTQEDYGPYVYECDVDDNLVYFKFNMGGNDIDVYYDNIQIIDLSVSSVQAIRFGSAVPMTYTLHNAYPNPFNPSATIPFDLNQKADVTIAIYDAAGRFVRTLTDQPYAAGRYEIEWHGLNQQGNSVPSGVYFAKMQVDGGRQISRKLTLIK